MLALCCHSCGSHKTSIFAGVLAAVPFFATHVKVHDFILVMRVCVCVLKNELYVCDRFMALSFR